MTPRLNSARRSLGVILLAAACGALPSLSVAQEPALDKVSLQLRWTHQFQFAGYYMAKEKGFYRDAGLEVEIRESRPGLNAMEEVVKGRSDFGVGLSGLLVSRQHGKPVVLLANIFQHSAMALAMRQDHPGDSVHSLAGKRVMLEPASDDIVAYLLKSGIKRGSFIPLAHSFQLQDLLDGRTDAMTVYTTDEVFTLNQAGFKYLLFTPRSVDIDFYGDNLFTSEAQVRAHPSRVKAFRDASLKGWKYAMEHPDEAIKVIRDKYGCLRSSELLAFEAEQTDALIMHTVVPIGYINPDRWKNIADTYVSLGVLPDTRALNGFLYLPKTYALPGWVNISLITESALILLSLFIITYVHRAKRRIARSEDKYRQLVEKAPIGIFVSTASGKPISSNPALLRMMKADAMPATGGTEDNVLKTAYMRPEDRDRIIQQLRREGHFEGQEVTYRRADGQPIRVDMSARIAEGDPQGDFVMEGFTIDITERKRAEDDLRKSQEQLNLILDHLPTPAMVATNPPDAKIIRLNQQFTETFGYTRADLPTMKAWARKIYPEDELQTSVIPRWISIMNEARTSAQRIEHGEFRVPDKSGRIHDIVFQATIFEDINVVTMHDITLRKQQELQLKENEQRLRQIIDGVPISIIVSRLREGQKILYINEQARRTFGYSMDEVPDLDTWRLKVFPDPAYRDQSTQKWAEAIDRARTHDGMIAPIEMKYMTRTGKPLQMLVSAVILSDSTQLTALVDITSLRETEMKLDQAQRELERAAYELTENIPMGTYTLIMRPGDERGRFAFMSKRFVAMTGFDFDMLRQHPEREIETIHPDDREIWKRVTSEAFQKKIHFSGVTRMIVRGETRWFAAEANPRPLPDGSTIWEGVMTDITDQKRAEQALHEAAQREQAQEQEHRQTLERKLKSSLMASAVAHEINQPLGAILMTIQMALQHRGDPIAALNAVARETQQVVGTIEKMRVLLRNVETKHTTVDLHEVIDSSLLQVNEMALDHGVILHRNIPEEPCRIPGDGAQLQLAITNILRNAIEASAHPLTPRRREVVIQLAIHSHEVELSVGDSGPGWSGAEPDAHGLKTTKPGGTGIGLMIVSTALQNHHGRMAFGASPLGGALITIYLPRHAQRSKYSSFTHS